MPLPKLPEKKKDFGFPVPPAWSVPKEIDTITKGKSKEEMRGWVNSDYVFTDEEPKPVEVETKGNYKVSTSRNRTGIESGLSDKEIRNIQLRDEATDRGRGVTINADGTVTQDYSKTPLATGKTDVAGMFDDPIFGLIGAAVVPGTIGIQQMLGKYGQIAAGKVVSFVPEMFNPGMFGGAKKIITEIGQEGVERMIQKTGDNAGSGKISYKNLLSPSDEHKLFKYKNYKDRIIKQKNTEQNIIKADVYDKKYGTSTKENIKAITLLNEIDNKYLNPMLFDNYIYAGKLENNVQGYVKKNINRMMKEMLLNKKKDDIMSAGDWELGLKNSIFDYEPQLKKTIRHEIGHIQDLSNKGMTKTEEEAYTNILYDYDYVIEKLVNYAKEKNWDIDKATKLVDKIDYYYTPSETKQWLITNLREDLLNSNRIKYIDDNITEDMLNKYINDMSDDMDNTDFLYYIDKNKIKDVVKLLNEAPLSIVTGATTIGTGATLYDKMTKQKQ